MDKIRHDFSIIIDAIPENSRVLDLGCADGTLLSYLKQEKNCYVHGLELRLENINNCIKKGIPVIQADLNDGLGSFADNSFDFVIVSETLQVLRNPDNLLKEVVRVGKTGIVNLINIGFWFDRFQLFFTGRMPFNKHLPNKWYNTPNIHLGTVKDFRELCQDINVKVTNEHPVEGVLCYKLAPNLFARNCIFLIEGK